MTEAERRVHLDTAAGDAGEAAQKLREIVAIFERVGLEETMLSELRRSSELATSAYRSLLRSGIEAPRRKDAPEKDLLTEAMRAQSAKTEALALAGYLRAGQPLADAYDQRRGSDWVDTLLELACKLENDAIGPKGSGLE